MGPWPVNPAAFDGDKFQKRYALPTNPPRFWIAQNAQHQTFLHLDPSITIPDDPPVFDPPDPPNINNRAYAEDTVAAQSGQGVTIRAVALTLLDLVNNTRAQMSPPLSQVTRQQFATQIKAKIDSGTVDT